ncbi:hypothetical protein A1D31_38315 [Bradyrhizobium liaoningense]|nr:hypothetical protein A1D31_38315 [Bradyrhizobium liaoningense]
MLRIALVFVLLASPAAAQLMSRDNSLQQQLVPESLPFEATAVATKLNQFEWTTTISYAVTNKTGMNLYMGVAIGGVSIGSCSRATRTSGGLRFLPPPGMTNYSTNMVGGDPQPIFAPAGARIAGSVSLDECSAPNPGSPTAPVSMSLMIGKTPSIESMIQYPVSATAPIRRVGE